MSTQPLPMPPPGLNGSNPVPGLTAGQITDDSGDYAKYDGLSAHMANVMDDVENFLQDRYQQRLNQIQQDFLAGRHEKAAGDLLELAQNPRGGRGVYTPFGLIHPSAPTDAGNQDYQANLDTIAEWMLQQADEAGRTIVEYLPQVQKALTAMRSSPVLYRRMVAKIAGTAKLLRPGASTVTHVFHPDTGLQPIQ